MCAPRRGAVLTAMPQGQLCLRSGLVRKWAKNRHRTVRRPDTSMLDLGDARYSNNSHATCKEALPAVTHSAELGPNKCIRTDRGSQDRDPWSASGMCARPGHLLRSKRERVPTNIGLLHGTQGEPVQAGWRGTSHQGRLRPYESPVHVAWPALRAGGN